MRQSNHRDMRVLCHCRLLKLSRCMLGLRHRTTTSCELSLHHVRSFKACCAARQASHLALVWRVAGGLHPTLTQSQMTQLSSHLSHNSSQAQGLSQACECQSAGGDQCPCIAMPASIASL